MQIPATVLMISTEALTAMDMSAHSADEAHFTDAYLDYPDTLYNNLYIYNYTTVRRSPSGDPCQVALADIYPE